MANDKKRWDLDTGLLSSDFSTYIETRLLLNRAWDVSTSGLWKPWNKNSKFNVIHAMIYKYIALKVPAPVAWKQ